MAHPPTGGASSVPLFLTAVPKKEALKLINPRGTETAFFSRYVIISKYQIDYINRSICYSSFSISLIRVRRIFLPKKKSVSTPSVSFIHQWRFPCRRGTRVNISTPFIPVHVTFEYSVTDYTGFTDKEHRLFRSTRNP